MEHLLPKPREMDFNAPNLAATWKIWKQNMEFYLTAMMKDDETFDQYMTELKNLASTCEFGELHDGLLTYKIVDGIRSEKVCDVLLRKGAEMTLAKAINICRTDEITKLQMKEMSSDREVNVIKKKYGKTSRHKNQGGTNQMSKSDQKSGTNQSRENSRTERMSCIWAGMSQVQEEESLGKLLSD